ncbi:hypothetical protein BU23DRAFT_579837 [Bimuria novae-zelandiae CBS 107.79]|uniref:Uncharacterized protein n=1 Tax=Bimuria novae-zelandiae CBS 107.79 TaxID=1447943 RepID=A0A6A5VB81_9PLEO|nr:hypothetical protein BU23DRAFT_579837 [Bimuria novae-zelandiae CBS 107.79]
MDWLHEFNFKIFIDVIYLSGKPVLYVINLATTFNSARFLRSIIKAVNNTTSPNGLVPTLLVFGAYPWKAIKALRRAVIERVREKNGWQGPYKVINIKNYDVTIDIVNGLTTFRSIVVKPYYQDTTIDPRKRGCPPGFKNKRIVQYLTRKEEDNYALAVKLRNNGVINTPGAPFKVSN